MASQPPSASTPTWPSAGTACSAGLYRAVSRTARSRDANSRRAGRLQPLELLLLLAEALDHPDPGRRRSSTTPATSPACCCASQLAGNSVAPRAQRDEPQRRADGERDQGQQRGEDQP